MNFFVIAREQRDRGDPVDNKVAHARVHNLLDCFATLAMTRKGDGIIITGLLRCARNDKGAKCNYFVIARELCDRGDPVDNKVAHARVHNLLDCFVSLAMTRVVLCAQLRGTGQMG